MSNAKALDQFYTHPAIAEECYRTFCALIHPSPQTLWIEPSVGTGAFGNLLQAHNHEFLALDLEPKVDYATQGNFFDFIAPQHDEKITIGNPPYGKRSKLAIDFLNKSLTDGSRYVGFVLPLQFRKWSVQSRIQPQARLIYDQTLPEKSFIFNGKAYGVRCCFQIWENGDFDAPQTKHLPDLRMKEKPKTEHEDFKIYQYNRTKEAEKFFDYDWDFCVVRQGYHDYTQKYFSADECDRKKQFIFFKAKNEEILNRLMSLDFEALSLKNTSTPGFGKADVVEAYEQRFGKGDIA